MDSVNVMVTSSLGDENLRQIAAVSPRVNLMDASILWNAPDMLPDDKRTADFSSEEFDSMLAQAEVIYGFRTPRNLITRAPKLKWIQVMLAGVDHFLTDDIVRSRVIVTNMSGVHASPVGEIAIALMLMCAKQAPFIFRSKNDSRWDRFIPVLLRSKTVGIVGLGSIGKEIARLSKSFGMRVIATRRSVKKVGRARNVDVLFPREQLPELLSQSDFVVLVLPSTFETVKMIGEKELRAMKSSAYLVNVGRGDTVDEEALIRALDENWIAGAGLDAYTREPLPVESKLWQLPNVILSPHVGGRLEDYSTVTTNLFCENLKRYVDGRKLFNVVNKKLGY